MAAIFRPSLFYANLFRILMLAQYSVTGWYFFTRVQPKLDWNDEEIQLRMKIAPSYLSLWNAVLQVVYLLLSLTEDYLLTSSTSKRANQWFTNLNKINSVVFIALLFPMTAMTTILFWFLYYFNSELLVPLRFLSLLPPSGHVSIHLLIMIPLFTEVIFANRRPVNYKTATFIFNITLLLYVLTTLGVYEYIGKWNYSIFESLDWIGRIAFMVFVYYMGLGLLNIGVAFQNFVKNNIKIKI